MPSSFNRKKESVCVCVYLNLLDRLCSVIFWSLSVALHNFNIETLTFWSFSVNLSQNSSLSNLHLLLSWFMYLLGTVLLPSLEQNKFFVETLLLSDSLALYLADDLSVPFCVPSPHRWRWSVGWKYNSRQLVECDWPAALHQLQLLDQRL